MLISAVLFAVIFSMILHFTQTDMEARSIQLLSNVPAVLPQPNELSENSPAPHILAEVNRHGKMIAFRIFQMEESDDSFVRSIVKEAVTSEEQTGVLFSYQLRYLKFKTPYGMRIVFGDIASEQRIMTNMVRCSILIYIVSLFVFLGASILLSRWIICPVEKAWNQQRQFIADASHELKTPLTVILTNVELLQNQNYSNEEYQKFISSIQTMSYQMRGLVEGLLDLARVDNGSVKMVFSNIQFDELIGEELLPFEPLFFEKKLEISVSLEHEVWVKGSETHLRQLINILLDNACKYSLAPGKVILDLKKQGSFCLLSLSNPCNELSRKDLKDIFRRFYRIDKARSMTQSYGLGLAIAEALTREHGGKIWAECRSRNITFFVQLPLYHAVNETK